MPNSLDLFKAILSSATDYAIITLDAARVVMSWNTGAQRVLGYEENEIVGHSGDVFFTPQDREAGTPRRETQIALRDGRAMDNRWHMRKDGSRFWGEGVVTPIHDASGTHIGFLKIMRDMTERKNTEGEMFRLAHFDSLTGLANRMYFQTRLREMIATAIRSKQLLIVQLIDLNNFKQINDSLGHTVGDQLLQQAAQRVRVVTRESDFIARLGGDEFVVLQADARSLHYGETLANKLLDMLSVRFSIEGREVLLGASIGIAVCPQDGTEPEQLMRNADLALHRTKTLKKSGFSYFTEQIDDEAHQRTRDIVELRRAIENCSFSLEYQPEVSFSDGRVVAAEALLRCRHPALKSYTTEKLIALGEESGLMWQIGLWVLTEACAQNKQWQNDGLPPITVCVNLCPSDLSNAELPQQIDNILKRTGLEPRYLLIEITERQVFETGGNGIRVLKELRARGIPIALDDFGAGYSALGYLRRLPIDKLKLDRTFMKEIPRDLPSCAVVRAVVGLAHAIGMEVVAEGVESRAQAEFCRQEKCDALQGSFVSPPLPAEKIMALLSDDNELRRMASVSQAIPASPK